MTWSLSPVYPAASGSRKASTQSLCGQYGRPAGRWQAHDWAWIHRAFGYRSSSSNVEPLLQFQERLSLNGEWCIRLTAMPARELGQFRRFGSERQAVGRLDRSRPPSVNATVSLSVSDLQGGNVDGDGAASERTLARQVPIPSNRESISGAGSTGCPLATHSRSAVSLASI
jgi:hypothetical protein